ncbi:MULTISPECIES: methyltransferase domain-containing protein [Aphanothece]|uniref:methyltransferase domain-containing protein n=1 Tax=Aphanothece TaxID=1121 RepID=UPI0039846CA6
MKPASDRWGFDRGMPVDRHYIEHFLHKHHKAISGVCLEVLNSDYTHHFGGDQVTQADVLDINAENPRATIIGDITDPSTLKHDHYDCFILTQTLQVVVDSEALLRNAFAAMKPGGVILITTSFVCSYSPHPIDLWRFTDASLRILIERATGTIPSDLQCFGNLVATIAFLKGLAACELSSAELDHFDKRYPIIIAARIDKPVDEGA